MRQPKLLQPSPTTETPSEPILRVCIFESATGGMIRNFSRRGDFQGALLIPGSAPATVCVISGWRTLFPDDEEKLFPAGCRKLRAGSPRSPDEISLQRECEHARNPSTQTQAERHQPHRFVVHQFTRCYPNRCSWCATTQESFPRTARSIF